MKIVVTSDTHVPVDISRIPDGDVFMHVGDLMSTGYPDDFARQLEWLAALPHEMKIYVPGNHDFHLQVYPGPALQQLRSAGVTVVGLPGNSHYDTVKLPNGMTVLGLPYVANLPRWAFNAPSEQQLFDYLTRFSGNDIILSHSPVYGILDQINDNSVGMRVYRKYFSHYLEADTRPKYWFCGHIHEAYGHVELEGTHFYNVAMCDRNHRHVNPPVVLDL